MPAAHDAGMLEPARWFCARMRARSVGVFVGVLVVVAVAGLVMWTSRGSDEGATPAVTQRNGSASAPTPASAPMRATGSITVTVTSARGPIAGAVVRLAPEDGDVLALETGRDGTAVADQLALGTWQVSASAPGHEPAALPAHELVAGDHAKLAITLASGGRTLTGVVTDVTGGPIAGARIDAARLGAMGRPDDAVATTITGADGRYQVTVTEGQLLVAARSADYAAQSRIVDVGPSGAAADFALVPGGVIEGIVLDAKTREPVAGALVEARRDSASIMLAETGARLATAGPDGRFRVTGLRPGAYELDAIAVNRRSNSATIVGLGVAEQVADVEILVGTSPVVRGTVVDETGAPMPGARVLAMSRGAGDEARADAQGAFVLAGLRPGSYVLFANTAEHIGAGRTPVEVRDADIDGVIVKVQRGAVIKGHVEPRQVADVRFQPSMRGRVDGPMRLLAPTTTGPDGEFAIGPTAAGAGMLSARGASGEQGSLAIEVTNGMPEVVLALTPGAAIAGRVLDGKGKPAAGVAVMAAPTAGEQHTMIVNGVITSGIQALTDATGAYEIRGLAAGTYSLSALERGRPLPVRGKAPKVTLGAAARKTGVDFTVERPDGVIRGVVLGPDGAPLADAWVSVDQDLQSMVERMLADREPGEGSMMMRVEMADDGDRETSAFPPALTDAEGRFEIRGLPAASYEVVAEAQAGKLRGRLPGVQPDATVTVRAAGVTTLSGTVTGPSGPTALFTVELDGPTRTQRTFTNGTFSLGRVDPGSYTVRVTSSDGNAEAKVEVSPGAPATVAIALVANATVVGTVVDAAEKPMANVPVIVVDDTGGPGLRIAMEGPPPTTGPDGRFRVEHKAGKGILVIMVPPQPVTRPGLVLEAGKTLDVGPVRIDATAPPP